MTIYHSKKTEEYHHLQAIRLHCYTEFLFSQKNLIVHAENGRCQIKLSWWAFVTINAKIQTNILIEGIFWNPIPPFTNPSQNLQILYSHPATQRIKNHLKFQVSTHGSLIKEELARMNDSYFERTRYMQNWPLSIPTSSQNTNICTNLIATKSRYTNVPVSAGQSYAFVIRYLAIVPWFSYHIIFSIIHLHKIILRLAFFTARNLRFIISFQNMLWQHNR